MKKETDNNLSFKIICVATACGSAISSYFVFPHSIALGVFCLIVTLIALFYFAGSVLAIRYLEGCVVRYLIHLGGTAKEEQINERYTTEHGNVDFVLSSLQSRGVISVNNEMVVLNSSEIDRGFYNTIMLWSTRKLYNQSLESDGNDSGAVR
jgi:hypothetical protein